MFFAVEKFEKRAREMAERRYFDMQSIAPMMAMPDDADVDYVHHGVPEIGDAKPFNIGDHFVGRDRYLWVTKDVTLPEHREGCEVVGRFNFGKTGGGFNSAFESLLYVDKQEYQGVDTYHNDVVFENMAGQNINMTFMLWTGLEGGGPHVTQYHRFQQAEIGYLHKAADEMYYFTRAIAGTLPLLSEDDPIRYQLTQALEHALLLINWDEDKYLDTVGDALACLLAEMDKIEKHTDITVYCIGHTHIDVAWLWRLKHTREKAQRSFATVLRYMEEFDEYVFMHTSPQVYAFIKEDCPELYERMKPRIAEGRWETDGAMWLEADCNITSGESLSRQLEHGIRFFKNEFNQTCEHLWLPDVFGYSWALPQLCKLADIKTFATTKISWNQFNSMPNDVFKWRGLDGTELLTYFIDVPYDMEGINQRGSTYNANIDAISTIGSWKKFQNKEITHNILVSYGHGDGGGGVDHDMLKMRRALDKIPGVPHVKPAKAGEFFRKLHEDVAKADEVPVWDGELYLEYHRGTYTSQARNKRYNRKLEFKLAQAEWLNSMTYILGKDYDFDSLYKDWDTMLLLQFHDIIPGSSINEVYKDSTKLYQGVEADADRNMAAAEAGLAVATDGDAFTVYNFGTWERKSLVHVALCGNYGFTLGDGTELQAQKCEGGYQVEVPVKGLSAETIYLKAQLDAEPESPFEIDLEAGTIETPFYSLTLDQDGFLTRVYDKENDREALKGRGNVLEIFEDKSINYDNWDLDIFYTQKKEYMKLASAALKEEGPLRAVIHLVYQYNRSTLEQDMILYAADRRIDFETHVCWHEDHRVLKAAFETAIRSTKASYDIQYGYVERPTHFNTSWDWAKFEVVGHKWGDISEQNYGVALLNDCKYGYNTKDSTIKLTLLKSSKYPDTEADMGDYHCFTYALYPHTGNAITGGVIEESTLLNLPLFTGKGASAVAGKQLFKLAGKGVQIDAVKKALDSDAVLIRFHECYGGTEKITLTSDFGVKSYTLCNLLEKPLEETITGDTLTRTLRPFEICNYLVEF